MKLLNKLFLNFFCAFCINLEKNNIQKKCLFYYQVSFPRFSLFQTKEQGKIYKNAQLKYLSTKVIFEEFPYLKNEKIISYSSGEFYHIVLKENGQLLGWGKNDVGQLAIEQFDEFKIPISISIEEKIISIGSGLYHCVVLSGKKLLIILKNY